MVFLFGEIELKLKPEEILQAKCNQWLSKNYPEFGRQYNFNSMQGMKMGWGNIRREKFIGGLRKNLLDFYFYKNNGLYSLLAIELKAEIPFNKNFTLKSNEHYIAQAETIELLIIENYYACFVWDFDQFKDIFIKYLDNTLPQKPQIIKKNGIYYYNLV